MQNTWEISEVQQTDKWGMTVHDPDNELDTAEDYIDFLPRDARTEAMAMRYGAQWNMTPDDVLDMDYGLFYRRTLVSKAVTLRKPQYTKNDWYMANTSEAFWGS